VHEARYASVLGHELAVTSGRLSLAQLVADLMRHSIFQGAMHPGEHLCQHKLARQHGMSRAPVREALVQLYAEGLLDHDRNRGYFVKRFSWQDIEQLYKMRRWLEDQLLRSLRWPDLPTSHQIAELRARVDRGPERAGAEAFEAFTHLRLVLFGLSPEQALLREASRLWVRLDRLRAYFRPEGSYAFSDALPLRDRTLLLDLHARERVEAERVLRDARSALPGIWSNAA
jgi:DNA-binding GntR family transcriptional regulator